MIEQVFLVNGFGSVICHHKPEDKLVVKNDDNFDEVTCDLRDLRGQNGTPYNFLSVQRDIPRKQSK